ncbi:MAG: hypothetical protein PHR30_18685 [Gallionellaceae bacterium]|nr:hypothetical protein [Gallionellaceae bacterium]
MSELSDAVETMMAALADAVEVWGRIGARLRRLEDRVAALALKTDTLFQAEKTRPAAEQPAAGETVHPSVPEMLKGVAKRLTALEDEVVSLRSCMGRQE